MFGDIDFARGELVCVGVNQHGVIGFGLHHVQEVKAVFDDSATSARKSGCGKVSDMLLSIRPWFQFSLLAHIESAACALPASDAAHFRFGQGFICAICGDNELGGLLLLFPEFQDSFKFDPIAARCECCGHLVLGFEDDAFVEVGDSDLRLCFINFSAGGGEVSVFVGKSDLRGFLFDGFQQVDSGLSGIGSTAYGD